jgi:hypothetical protein
MSSAYQIAKKLSLLAIVSLGSSSVASAAIVAGDIAFVGANATDPDNFAILFRNNVAAGNRFVITDGGYTGVTSGAASGWFRNTESYLLYTAPAGGIAAGSVLLFTGGGVAPSVANNGSGNAGTVSLENGISFSLSPFGDQLTAFTVPQGTTLQTGTPSLLAFVDFGVNPYGTGTAQSSSIPTISGGQVLNLANLDNFTISPSALVSGVPTIAFLSTASNFSARDTTRYDLSAIAPVPEPNGAILAGLLSGAYVLIKRRRKS